MFKIESYVTPILLSYVDKYVRDFKPADAQLSLWAGGVTLHNLVLKADVLQKEVALPFTLVSGRIHELLIQVPWTKIMSEPIVVTINTIECVLSLNPPTEEAPPPEQPRTQVVEAPPGYMQALVRRIVSNIAVRVHSLIVKYVHDDVVLSLNVKRLAIDSVGADWEPSFADIDQNQPAIRRLVRLDDLTLCLDKSDSDGKIRFYQEPLLYRCQLDLRVLTRLVSANTRRARSLSIQLTSTRLAWGVTNEQLVLLLRLIRERNLDKPPPPVVKTTTVNPATPLHPTSSNTAEPARSESWSEWAWSWLPTWVDREGVEETQAPAAPVPVAFTAHLDLVSLVFKIMESENSRKRARGILELKCTDAVIKSSLCSPTMIRVRIGAKTVTVESHGKCVCGHVDINAHNEEPTVYLNKVVSEYDVPWRWEEVELNDQVVETAVAADEELKESTENDTEPSEKPAVEPYQDIPMPDEGDQFWQKMAPLIYFEYNHDRTPLNNYVNPYDNPPRDFEYSDWIEDSNVKISIRPMLISVSTGLLHRLAVLSNVFQEVPKPADTEPSMRILTVEECEALSENLPQRHTAIDITGLRIRVSPWDHSLVEKPVEPPLVLDLQLPKATVLITGPLYPHRVCSAACQVPQDSGPLWQGANLHVSATVTAVQLGVCTTDTPRPCARADLRFVTHTLLNSNYFGRDTVLFSYNLKIREANLCGSSARLQAAYQVMNSVMNEKFSIPLRHTTLAKDALDDEESVAVDITFEELSIRGYLTTNINTHIVSMQCARATAFHSPIGGLVKQAWLFSAPEAPTTTPYLRLAIQWCKDPTLSMLEYAGVWIEPTAFSMDPLLIAWLGYRPRIKMTATTDSMPQTSTIRTIPSSQYIRRRATPPVSQNDISKSSSGRGGSRPGSGAELVHVRPRSQASSSEKSERKEAKPPQKSPGNLPQWTDDMLLNLHRRLNRLLLTAEVGLVLVYVTSSSVSAVDCATVRDTMEKHAATGHRVLVFSFGRLSMHSNAQMKHIWQEVRHDHPTLRTPKLEQNANEDSFPWKMRLADVSCYTLEAKAGTSFHGREKSASGIRSQLKFSGTLMPRPVLDLVSTTITLSVVTKTLQIKTRKVEMMHKHTETKEEDRTKFFTAGVDFKPSSLKEFIRGPVRRKKSPEPEEPLSAPEPEPAQVTIKSGPVVSLGVNLHADTPPILVRLDQEQVQAVSVAIHCFSHILSLLTRRSLNAKTGFTSLGSSSKLLMKSVSEVDARQNLSEGTSDNPSEQLMSIFESHQRSQMDTKLKTFFWFQWVVSRATLVVATPELKVAFVIDDVISTVDLQDHYNQLKVKVASASVRHYKRTGSDEWTAGVLGGRILEVREPTNAKEENHFLAVTITQARISNLPVSWKEELHPKLLEQNANVDSMWEVYATLAPLEAVLQPDVLDHMLCWLHDLTPQTMCPLRSDDDSSSTWQWPFCYVSAGGLRLLLTNGEEDNAQGDDTVMLVIGKVAVNPHPDNPICRQSVNAVAEASWSSPATGFEGRQYEVLVKNLAVRTARFSQLVNEEATESKILKGIGGENPALKWSQPSVSPIITPVLHSMDISCVLAPAIYNCGVVSCGAAVELNLLSDCAIELAVSRLNLIRDLALRFAHALRHREESSFIMDEDTTCSYAAYLINHDVSDSSPPESEATLSEEVTKSTLDVSRSLLFDSGFETTTSQSTYKLRRDSSAPIKKSVSIVGVDYTAKSSDFLEAFVTMGTIDVSLYASDDGSAEVAALKPPPGVFKAPEPKTEIFSQIKVTVVEDKKDTSKKDECRDSLSASRSLTETHRNADVGKTQLEQLDVPHFARQTEGNIPLLHVTLQQPNFYYRKRKKQKTIQISLFNAWVGLGTGPDASSWNAPLMSTGKGTPDPVSDIPPALATLRLDLTTGGHVGLTSGNPKGAVQLEIERPVLFEVSADRILRIRGIVDLLKKNLECYNANTDPTHQQKSLLLYKMRRYMVANQVWSVTIHTGQMGVRGCEGIVGWGGLRVQLAAGTRPEKLNCRVLLSALMISAGPATDCRHVLLQPMMAGAILDATWEAWRRAEGGPSAKEPTIRMAVDLDQMTVDLRPTDLAALVRIQTTLKEALGIIGTSSSETSSTESVNPESVNSPSAFFIPQQTASDTSDTSHHYYKDDLRYCQGGQLPMAYQVTLHGSTVSWRYPHPRAITRLVAFPIPGHVEEVECALELYCPLLTRWEPHAYFQLPVNEPQELQISVTPSDAVFALMWRVRACSDTQETSQPFEFDARKFMPRQDPMVGEPVLESDYYRRSCRVSAEQVSGALRVDSYFAPRMLPRARLALRLAGLDVYAHNGMPRLPKQMLDLEGYYVSRPLMRSHRVLCLRIRDSAAHAVFAMASRMLFDMRVSSDLIDSATGAMQELVQEFRVQGTMSLCADPRLRLRAGDLRLALHVPGVSTLKALARDWMDVYKQYITCEDKEKETETGKQSTQEIGRNLEGRVSLWVHNGCANALRVGQEGTDEIVPLSSGAALAYRWHSPTASKKLRFALPNPGGDWHWSSSIPFSGTACVRVDGVYLYVHVTDSGSRRDMYLSGRLVLANVLRHNLLYKVRSKCTEKNSWQTISSGELHAESVGLSVLCSSDCETILKVKFTNEETGWSGDIPLKECRKENVPWLVKVPSAGEVSYTSVWCRVVRARGDARVIATIWPFYILRSYLPLDADVLITSDTGAQGTEPTPPIVQTASGRGMTTHIIAPGTTAARHTLTFQYKNIDCPVTREAVPLHYGVTDTSVFEKPSPVNDIEEVIEIVQKWIKTSGKDVVSSWPYSIVSNHWPGSWSPALLQPRCDVSIRYAAVRACGGCSLELRLCPVVLLANASPVSLTLRAHDAAPLCRLEPGIAIAPPSAVVQKPFFISVEMGRETFVSGQLQVCKEEPGRYGNPAPGHVTLDRATDFAIQCNQKVALLTMYYEIQEDINVLGITSTFILINRLNTPILVSPIAIPNEMDTQSVLRPKAFKVVQPTKEGSLQGTPLCRFWVRGRWRGGDAEELRTYLCLAMPAQAFPVVTPVPVALGVPPVRRALSLTDENGESVCLTVTQVRHEARWLVTVAPDPCPQLVVNNHTAITLAVAEPVVADSPLAVVKAVSECPGVRWWCSVESRRATHYSTPSYSARYPPPAVSPHLPLPTLTVGRTSEDGDFEWSQPVAIADGEQLVQLAGGVTVKLRVRTYPHSSHVELQDVDENDISASDIRRRLLGVFSEESLSLQEDKEDSVTSYEQNKLLRTTGADKLLDPLMASQENPETKDPDQMTLLSAGGQTDLLSASQIVTEVQENPQEDKIVEESTKNTTRTILIGDTQKVDSADANTTAAASSMTVVRNDSNNVSDTSYLMEDVFEKAPSNWCERNATWAELERVRFVLGSLAVTVSAAPDVLPLVALHLQRAAVIVHADARRIRTTLSILDVQVDNAQYETEQYDFAVVATTRPGVTVQERWPPLWGMVNDVFATRSADARLQITTCHDKWTVAGNRYNELTEVEICLGPLGLYIEDAFLGAAVELYHLAAPMTSQTSESLVLAECRTLQNPLRLRKLHIHPLNLSLTLHTAVRMYIALDESPLRLSAFTLQDVMTSPDRLTHAFTVHYLSAAILGAGWVVGGLELLGAPGALAARVGSAGGGLRGVASTAAAALLRSLSAAAGSLARNLDLLAGDHEHARRAAAARRRPPTSLMAGLVAGITNFAINILGAVGGLAHHPLVGVAVGESGSAAALRRGILGAITKPLSATADLVAYAGHGLLTQTGWDTIPQPRECVSSSANAYGWRRDCVRWSFRLAELSALAGYDALLDQAPVHLLLTHKFLVVADTETERIVEMIDFKTCTLGPYEGQIIELHVAQKRTSRTSDSRVAVDEDNEYQISAAAMARVARYTGAEGYSSAESRVLMLLPSPGLSHALYAALAAALHHNANTHFPFM